MQRIFEVFPSRVDVDSLVRKHPPKPPKNLEAFHFLIFIFSISNLCLEIHLSSQSSRQELFGKR
ncbi:hypothetical protein I3842_Q122600 [Carya illinoinensis]|uniref:Uncharacterized protein n=1 Tax=Carya illinoinensis TaxID=32201 RepID=A0A921ZXF5_CARIL|nr:hypothetical protein I3842_Q122600 [Carya illinoinensis]